MIALLRISSAIDWICMLVGKVVSWLVLAAVLVSAGNAVIRKAFDMSSNAWLELQWYLFGAVFLLAAAYTLQRNEHIRIDIVSGTLSKRTRNWIDLFGHLAMLMPFVLLMLLEALPYVALSMRSGERSSNAGGLVLWPAKALILAGFALLFAQGISEIIKRVAIMRGALADPDPDRRTASPAAEQLSPKEPRA